jgi:hypothetical protein
MYFEEFEFGGSGDPYIEVFGVPKAPPSYYTICYEIEYPTNRQKRADDSVNIYLF